MISIWTAYGGMVVVGVTSAFAAYQHGRKRGVQEMIEVYKATATQFRVEMARENDKLKQSIATSEQAMQQRRQEWAESPDNPLNRREAE